ncbi:carboxypeptidase-like regulatory domain-containing protein [Joostella sp. CR20]|uniref:carboxypeptidase-like regulatory domain-containing protein n=1 Tax=Joostella sp. CR20 TaxID=2804312 RepID=UPI00313B61C3
MSFKVFRCCLLVILSCCFGSKVFSQNEIVGKVLDANSSEVIPYVNIGVEGKNIGTISKDDGSFRIQLTNKLQGASITFSCVGFEKKTVAISALKKNPEVTLTPNILMLDEVVLSEFKKQKRIDKKLGGYKKTWFNTGEANTDSYGQGKEYGLKIESPGVEYKIEKINFSLSENTIDSVLFRINIYKLTSDGEPTNSILPEQLFVKTYKGEHLVSADVSKIPLNIDEDIMVSIEPVRLWYDVKNDNQLFYAQAKGKNQSYLRNSSLSNWIKNELPPFSIFLDVFYYK